MPQFYPGETKTAKANMRNPAQKAFDYTGFLYMGTDLAVMSEVPFSLSAGQEKQISFPVTMPVNTGVYPVHLGVFCEGRNIALYRAEDVVIAPPMSVEDYHYVYQSTYTWSLPPIIHAKQCTHVGFRFKNKWATPISGVSVKMKIEWPEYYFEGVFDPLGGDWLGRITLPAGSAILTAPLDQYLHSISQPFVAAPGITGVWFSFNFGNLAAKYYSPPAEGPSPLTITAWVYVNGSLVAKRVISSSVSYT